MEGKMMLQILIITCFMWNSMSRPNSHLKFQSFLSTVVEEKVGAYEVNIQISGPNGYCIGVNGGDYSNGTPIVLWYCTDKKVNMLWTFESDGTIQSNGKCLTTNANSIQGSYIMIHDCTTAPQNTTIWQLTNGGIMANPGSGLVLTAISGELHKTLTLEANTFSSFQTWRASNHTEPSLVSIIGLRGLCLQVSNHTVWVETCENSNAGQRWFLYQDGTIRPQQNPNECLSYDVDVINKRVVVLSCGLKPSNERWLFTPNGTILNEASNLVMDVRGSDPSLKQIIVYRAKGSRNQKWEILPISN